MLNLSISQYCQLTGASKDDSDVANKIEEYRSKSIEEVYEEFGKKGLSYFTVVDLKDALKSRNLTYGGRKEELVERLEESLSNKKRKADDDDDESSSEKKQKTEEVDLEGKNPGNVAGGYKATLSNPNVSAEAKEHAEQVLSEMDVDSSSSDKTYKEADLEGKNPNNVAGGYKATLKNDNVSEEAKENAQKQLEKMGVDPEEKKNQEADVEGKNPGNVIGGYRAALHNDKVSDEAKENAKEQLEKMGVDPESDASKDKDDTEGKNLNNVIGGYKATLKNPNASDEAKNHAVEKLTEMGVSPNDDQEISTEGKDMTHVIGGYKSTLSNPNTSEEAKEKAWEALNELGADIEVKKPETYQKDVSLEGKNINNVIGGFKATLSNPNASEEAKNNAEEKLAELGADEKSKDDGEDVDLSGKNKNNVIGGYKATLSNPNVSEEAKENARDALDNLQTSQ